MEGNPKLRPVETRWISHNGQPAVLLRDTLGLSQEAVVVPQALAPLLSLCDGTRDLRMVRAGFELRTGIPLLPSTVERLVEQLDEALLLENPRFQAAYEAALAEYRGAPCRPMALAGQVYPREAEALGQLLGGYCQPTGRSGALRGLVCPHIDFARGGPTYGGVWQRAVGAAREADLVLVFGTDHAGGGPGLTLTRQSYATPWGTLPTDLELVEAVARALGPEAAFTHELHHRGEHSIEAALVWLHYIREGRACSVVPVLCGGLEAPHASAAPPPRLLEAQEALRRAARGRRILGVAAADLAHVGPAFGDPYPLGPQERSSLAAEDGNLLASICRGDAEALLATVHGEGDRRRVCGLPPIYALLRFLGECQGEVTGYAQCPADPLGASLVSVAGVVLW